MNEGFSDIFGTAIEFYARPSNADWLIGGDFYTIRSMSNPNAYSQPDTYKGTYWYTGTSDNGGVHTNSGVLNFWFYLLSAGGSGTNDNGTAYNVTGIGIDKAAAIAFRTNTVYLVSTSKYSDARAYSIQAASDLYGATSAEVTQTTNAWDAVGVGVAVPPPPCSDIFESNETISAAKSLPLNTDNVALISSSTDKDWYTFTCRL
jgi:Zn-dependent metalloprotease